MEIDDLIDFISDNEHPHRAKCKVCGKTFNTHKGIKLHVWRHIVEYNRINEILKIKVTK